MALGEAGPNCMTGRMYSDRYGSILEYVNGLLYCELGRFWSPTLLLSEVSTSTTSRSMMAYVIVRANRPLIDLICQFQMALLALRLHAHTDKWCRLGRKAEKAEESQQLGSARLGSARILTAVGCRSIVVRALLPSCCGGLFSQTSSLSCCRSLGDRIHRRVMSARTASCDWPDRLTPEQRGMTWVDVFSLASRMDNTYACTAHTLFWGATAGTYAPPTRATSTPSGLRPGFGHARICSPKIAGGNDASWPSSRSCPAPAACWGWGISTCWHRACTSDEPAAAPAKYKRRSAPNLHAPNLLPHTLSRHAPRLFFHSAGRHTSASRAREQQQQQQEAGFFFSLLSGGATRPPPL